MPCALLLGEWMLTQVRQVYSAAHTWCWRGKPQPTFIAMFDSSPNATAWSDTVNFFLIARVPVLNAHILSFPHSLAFHHNRSVSSFGHLVFSSSSARRRHARAPDVAAAHLRQVRDVPMGVRTPVAPCKWPLCHCPDDASVACARGAAARTLPAAGAGAHWPLRRHRGRLRNVAEGAGGHLWRRRG